MLKTKRSIRLLICLTLACVMLITLFGFSVPTASAKEIETIPPVNTVDCYVSQILKNRGNGKVMTEKSGRVESFSFDSNNSQLWDFQCTEQEGYFKIKREGRYLTSPTGDKNKERITVEGELTSEPNRQLWRRIEHLKPNGDFDYYTFQAKNREKSELVLAAEKILFNINGGYIWQESISNDYVKWTMEYKPQSSSQSF